MARKRDGKKLPTLREKHSSALASGFVSTFPVERLTSQPECPFTVTYPDRMHSAETGKSRSGRVYLKQRISFEASFRSPAFSSAARGISRRTNAPSFKLHHSRKITKLRFLSRCIVQPCKINHRDSARSPQDVQQARSGGCGIYLPHKTHAEHPRRRPRSVALPNARPHSGIQATPHAVPKISGGIRTLAH
jgi:hypothetical protein